MKEIIKKNLYEKFDEDFDEILYFLECIDSINCDVFTDGYGSYSYFYDGDFIGNDTANESREIIDNVFEYIKCFNEDLELIAKELNINDDKVRKEDKENVNRRTAETMDVERDDVMKINHIYQGDCLELMKEIPDDFIDLTVTSPPYDNLRTYNGNIKHWSFEKFKAIAKELYRVTKQGGVVVWIVGDATINGSETGTSFKQALYFKEIGFNLHDTMIWKKTNPIPLTHNRYEQHFEYMFVFSKGSPKTFNPIKIPCATKGQIRNRKNSNKEEGSAVRNRNEVTVTKSEKIKGNVWEMPVSNTKYNHPAIFPEQLAKDHILSWSNEGDVVLDPFMGSGTTAKMALLNNRNFIGFELSQEYCKIAEKRIEPYLM